MKIAALMLVINEEDYVYYALKSIQKVVDEIIVVEGAVRRRFASDAVAWGTLTPEGLSGDGTHAEILRFQAEDSEGKMTYLPAGWTPSVNELRQLSLQAVSPDVDYCLVLDADTLYAEADIIHLRQLVEKYPFIGAVSAMNLMFFRDLGHVLVVGDAFQEHCHYVDSGFFWKRTPQTRIEGQRPDVGGRKYESLLTRIRLADLSTYRGDRDVYVYEPRGVFIEFHYGWVHTPSQIEGHLLRWAHTMIDLVAQGGGDERMQRWCAPLVGMGDVEILEYYRTYHKLWTGLYDDGVEEHLEEFEGEHPAVMQRHPYYGKSAEELGWR